MTEVVRSSELKGIYKMWGADMMGYRVNEEDERCVYHAVDETRDKGNQQIGANVKEPS